MASVKYGAIVTELKGSVAGQTFQGGNVGYILRTKGYTKGMGSDSKQLATRALSQVTQLWRALSASDQAAWNAISGAWTFVDRFGNTYSGSGYQVHNSYNANLISIGMSPVSTPGALAAPVDPGVLNVAVNSTTVFDVSWDNAGGAADNIVVFASPPLASRTNSNNIRLTKLTNAGISGDTATSVSGAYDFIYGGRNTGAFIKVRAIWRLATYPRNYFTQDFMAVVV